VLNRGGSSPQHCLDAILEREFLFLQRTGLEQLLAHRSGIGDYLDEDSDADAEDYPLGEISDIAAIAALAKKSGAVLIVDNALCTPALQRPLEFGADLVIHSATKYLDGQGRVIGGAVAGSKALVADALIPFLRTAGPSISPFNAWVLSRSLETLEVRMERHASNAFFLAQELHERRQSAVAERAAVVAEMRGALDILREREPRSTTGAIQD